MEPTPRCYLAFCPSTVPVASEGSPSAPPSPLTERRVSRDGGLPSAGSPQVTRHAPACGQRRTTPLVRGSSAASAPAPRRWWWRRSLEAIDVALELGTGQATAAADVQRPQLSGLDEPVDRRASDPQHPSGFLRRQQQHVAGQPLLERLRISHVGNRGRGGSGKPPVALAGMSTIRGRRPTGTASSAVRYWRTTGDRSSVHGRGAGHVGAPSVGLQHGR